MTLSSLLLFAAALFVAAGSPGPSVAALVARGLSRGYRDVMPFLAAMWIGEAVWLSLAIAGLAAVAQTFHLAFVAIKWAGVAYLLVLAWKMWRAPAEIAGDEAPEDKAPLGMFLTGLALTLGNPKIMVFYMALLPTLLDLAAVSLLGWAELLLVMFAVLAFVDLAWVFFAAKARSLLKSPRAVRIANRLSAGTMGAAAAAIAARS
ncbi:LysE family translocator [Gellertiella hungarica]|uniref:Threonine/homoserine/homoserine lactone efflux protein n=1 Tax=Gellertiella hungarica TaxID=1572859 RepID=A0A7W6J6S9_9HYPH|nr:LysE family translocator [Gellertiella hungarica]MBB4065848.1 threonine/homoserine/homoserine lactone efflux protein [Gellertiella hungarica]